MKKDIKKLTTSFKALANERRLLILKFLRKKGEASVSEIAREIKLSIKSTSRHLSVLRAVDFVECEQRSLLVFYCVSRTLDREIKHLVTLF
ncbi:MAG TPA: metalloregulator ArsR/SmtB family transcription factor [Candidatus Paceibacterota bacterium]